MLMVDITTSKVHRIADRTWNTNGNIIDVTLTQSIFNPFRRMFWVKYFHFTSAIKGRVYKIYSTENNHHEYVILDSIACNAHTAYSSDYIHRLRFKKLNNFEVFKYCGAKKNEDKVRTN